MTTENPSGDTRLPTLAALRKTLGISQRRLAAISRIHKSSIGAIEAGIVPVFAGWRERIALALGMQPEQIDWDEPRRKR